MNMNKRKLSDYTPDEIARFTLMEKEVKRLNEVVARGGEMAPSPYSREEIGELSRYQQHVLVDRLKD
jgi:hypothetical protein